MTAQDLLYIFEAFITAIIDVLVALGIVPEDWYEQAMGTTDQDTSADA